MKGQVLAKNFKKRELNDAQHKSDNDKQSLYINKTMKKTEKDKEHQPYGSIKAGIVWADM